MYTNGDLVGLTNDDGFIRVFNFGAFVAQIAVSYYLNGDFKVKQSPEFFAGASETLTIPSNAKGIRFGAYVAVYFQAWRGVYRRSFLTPPRKCFAMNGITLYANCFEIPCAYGGNGNKPCGCYCNCSC